MHASENSELTKKPPQGIVKMFQRSLGLSDKKSMALHPHLYSGLYHRASEIKALDKILNDLRGAAEEAKQQKYTSLPPILNAIRDTLAGKPQLSWWTLFTLTVGHALASSGNEEEKNIEENNYLAQISEILTHIIRNFRSSNSKLLLEIRLAALEVDSRLIEIEKIPEDIEDIDETLEYIASEFNLLNKEIERIKKSPINEWNNNSALIFQCAAKANQLMRILLNLAATNPTTYQKFLGLPLLKKLNSDIAFLLSEYRLADDHDLISFWQKPELEELYELVTHFPNILLALKPHELYTLLLQTENLFIEDTNLNKKRPQIFSAKELVIYINHLNEEFTKQNMHMRAVIKGIKEDRAIKHNMINYFKQRLMDENDLHHIASKIRFGASERDLNSEFKTPVAIQQQILNRMILLANISQPKELDAVLKSFSDDEKENRFFLTQEVILEQFIRWRKQGIY